MYKMYVFWEYLWLLICRFFSEILKDILNAYRWGDPSHWSLVGEASVFLNKGRLIPTVVFFAWEFEFGLFNYWEMRMEYIVWVKFGALDRSSSSCGRLAAGRRGGVDMSVSKVEISFLPQSIRHISQKGLEKKTWGNHNWFASHFGNWL